MLALTKTSAVRSSSWAWTSGRCRRAPSWSGSATAPGSDAPWPAGRGTSGPGAPLPPDWALQDPGDYTDALGAAVRGAIRESGVDPGQVTGIATDFTASTCMPVLTDGTPLCQLPDLAARPHAYPKL